MSSNTKDKIVKQEELIYSINEEEKTANIIGNECTKPDLIIPRMIFHEGQEFIIKCIKEKSFDQSQIIRTVRFVDDSEVELIEKKSFYSSSIEEIYLPSRLKCIGECSFSYCQKLRVVDIPQNSELQRIKKYAFEVTIIESLTLPSSICELEEEWCSKTPKLKNIIYFPNPNYFYLDGKYIIGKSDRSRNEYDVLIFVRRDLENAIIPSFVKIIGESAFEQTNIKTILIPSQVTEIRSNAFCDCHYLINVDFETNSQLKVIGNFAFSHSSLTSIFIPSHVEKICDFAFMECFYLLQVEFAADSELQIIGSCSFAGTLIGNVSLPSSVREIKDEAFNECTFLTKFIIPEDSKLQTIGRMAFETTEFKSLLITANVSNLEDGWCSLTQSLVEVNISEDNKYYKNYGSNNEFVIGKSDKNESEFDALLFANRKQKIITIPPFIKKIGCSSFEDTRIERITIPRKVTHICEDAFEGCDQLRYVDIESNSELQVIGKSAFESSSIVSFQVPPSVTCISNDAFNQCENLQIIEFDENSAIGKINEKTFFNYRGENFIVMIPPKLWTGSNE